MNIYKFELDNKKYYFDPLNLGVFSYNDEENIVYSKEKEGVDSFKKNYFTTLTIIMTNNCNLCCSYCYANQGNYDNPNLSIDINYAFKAIDLLKQSIINNNDHCMNITFFGGEPLLEFGKIVAIVDYCEEITRETEIKVEFTLITNGTITNEIQVNFFKEKNFYLIVSIDGNKDVHDKFRLFKNNKGSYDIIEKNIKKYLENKIDLVLRVTINNYNNNLNKTMVFLKNNFNVRRFAFDFDKKMEQKNFNIFIKSIPDLFNNYYEDLKNGKYYIINEIFHFLTDILFIRKKSKHCSSGVAYLTLSADGYLYSCQRFVGEERYIDKNIMNITLLDINETKKCYLSNYEQLTKCINCSFYYLCGSICEHNKIEKISFENNCLYKKTMIKETLKFLVKLDESGVLTKLFKFIEKGGFSHGTKKC